MSWVQKLTDLLFIKVAPFSLATLCSLSFLGCSDRPGRERFPGPVGQTTDLQQAQATRAVLGGTDSFGARLEEREAAAKTLSGSVNLGKGKSLKPNMILFISLRSLTQPGPPLAAKRSVAKEFPYQFKFTAADMIMQGRSFSGAVQITARLDQDGDPLTQQPGDLWGGAEATIGEKNVSVVIDESVN